MKAARQRRPDVERMEADRLLYERLRHADFTGREMKQLREDLWIYGWQVMRAWMRDGTIVAKCRERNVFVHARYHEVEILMRRGDLRDGLAHDAVETALTAFTEKFLPERWNPDKGATMRTYFTRACMYAFRDAFKIWSRSYRWRLGTAAGPFAAASFRSLYDFEQPSPSLPFEDSASLRETIQQIMAGASPQARAICGLIWEGKVSQKEIGDELGMTSRSVEGHMRRLRTRAKAMVAKGEIEALYREAASVRKAESR